MVEKTKKAAGNARTTASGASTAAGNARTTASGASTAAANTAASFHLEEVALNKLHNHPENDYSMDSAELKELAESIAHDGLAQPPLVREVKGGYQIISGHRRVAAYRKLAKKNAAYNTIPVNVLEDCSDERALVLLDATNLMVRQLSVAERAKRYERLWNLVPQLRKNSPELKGVRTSQIIADLITQETGQAISRATVDRILAAGKRAQQVSDLVREYGSTLIKPWAQEFNEREGFSPAVVKEVASRTASVQKQLWASYQRDELSPKQFERQLVQEAPKTEADIEHALDSVIRTLRNVSAWNKQYGARIDAYRLDYIKGQLSNLK